MLTSLDNVFYVHSFYWWNFACRMQASLLGNVFFVNSSTNVLHLPERVQGPFLKFPVDKVCTLYYLLLDKNLLTICWIAFWYRNLLEGNVTFEWCSFSTSSEFAFDMIIKKGNENKMHRRIVMLLRYQDINTSSDNQMSMHSRIRFISLLTLCLTNVHS